MLKAITSIRKDPLAFLDQMWRRHGDVVQFPIPRPPTYLITDPDGVQTVLVTNARQHTKRTLQYDNLAYVTGNGLLTADDPPWSQHRRIIAPAFHQQALRPIADQITAATVPFLDDWCQLNNGSIVDVEAAMMELSLNVVAAALFGAQWQQQSPNLTKATVAALDQVIARARNPLAPPLSWPTPGNRRLRRSVAQLDAAVASVLTARSADIERGSDLRRDVPPDLVDLLVANSHGSDASFDTRGVRDELVTFLVAGHETVASAMTWVWSLLSRNRDVLDRLHVEVDEVLAGRVPSIADLPALVWTRAIVDEALRLYPPAWVITRKSTCEQELGGHLVPDQSLLIISPWLLHRHPQNWERPESFEPQRFLERSSKPASDYLPFGLGPRLCIGRELSLMECTLILASVAARFEFVASADLAAPPVLASVTLRPLGGLRLSLRHRPGHRS